METIALRVIRYSGSRQVYVGTLDEWSALRGDEVASTEQAISALRSHIRLGFGDEIVEALRFRADYAITVASILEQIEADRIAAEELTARQEQERQESLHRGEIMCMLDEASTRVQLGRRSSIAGIELFEVSLELDQQVDYEQLVQLQSETGLEVRLIAVAIEHSTDTIATNYSRDWDGGESYEYSISDISSEIVYRTVYL